MSEQPDKPSKREILARVKGKISSPVTRARKRAKTMALIKQVEHLVDLLGPHKDSAVQVLIDQLTATRNVYANGQFIDSVPDQVIRQKAAIAILEWLEGKPHELQVQIRGDVDDFAAMLEKARNSPAALNSLQKTVEGKEITIESENPPSEPDQGAEKKD